jgi:hypothetical protein
MEQLYTYLSQLGNGNVGFKTVLPGTMYHKTETITTEIITSRYRPQILHTLLSLVLLLRPRLF